MRTGCLYATEAAQCQAYTTTFDHRVYLQTLTLLLDDLSMVCSCLGSFTLFSCLPCSLQAHVVELCAKQCWSAQCHVGAASIAPHYVQCSHPA